jgi:hypothetical protein
MSPPICAEPACTFGIYLDSGVNKRMRKLQFTLLDRQRNSRGQDRGAAALQSPAVREHGQERLGRDGLSWRPSSRFALVSENCELQEQWQDPGCIPGCLEAGCC